MPWFLSFLGSRIRSFFRDYDSLQSLAITLLYIEIGCALIGSLGALFNGVLLINLVVALFALVAIESGNQTLGRTYAVLLFFAIVLDIAWFILFSHTIWNITPSEKFGVLIVFSVQLALWMQIIGFSIRFFSSFVWIQMYRLGASSGNNNPTYNDSEYDARNSFLSRSGGVARENSVSDEILGGSIYDPAYYSSLFKDVRDNGCILEGDKQLRPDGESTSGNSSPQIKTFTSRYFQSSDGDKQLRPDGESTSGNLSPQIKTCASRYSQSIDVDPSLTESLNP